MIIFIFVLMELCVYPWREGTMVCKLCFPPNFKNTFFHWVEESTTVYKFSIYDGFMAHSCVFKGGGMLLLSDYREELLFFNNDNVLFPYLKSKKVIMLMNLLSILLRKCSFLDFLAFSVKKHIYPRWFQLNWGKMQIIFCLKSNPSVPNLNWLYRTV